MFPIFMDEKMEITEFDCSVHAIKGVIDFIDKDLPLEYFVSPVLSKHFDDELNCLRLMGDHPIEGLTDHGVKSEKRIFKKSDMKELKSFVSESNGIVVQHSFSSLLRGRGIAKQDFLRDVQHLFYCNEMNIKEDNVILKPIDPVLKILTWNHLFYGPDDSITIYKINTDSTLEHTKQIATSKMENSILQYEVSEASVIDMKIIASIRNAYMTRDYAHLVTWMNAIRKLFITRCWFGRFVKAINPDNSISKELICLSESYRTILERYSSIVSNKTLDELNQLISEFEEILKTERELTVKLKMNIRSHFDG